MNALNAPLNTLPLGASPLFSVAQSETKEGKERLEGYYQALGQFIDAFSRLEAVMFFTLMRYCQLTSDIANIIFDRKSVGDAAKHLKQLVRLRGSASEIEDLLGVLAQFEAINEIRNAIIHYGAQSIETGKAIVSNEYRTKAAGTPKTFPISPDILRHMTADTRKIILHLRYRHGAVSLPRSAYGKDTLEKQLAAPWQYHRDATNVL